MVYIQGMNPTKVVPVAPVGWRVVAWLGAVVGSCVELKDDWAGDWEGARDGAVVGPCHFQVHRWFTPRVKSLTVRWPVTIPGTDPALLHDKGDLPTHLAISRPECRHNRRHERRGLWRVTVTRRSHEWLRHCHRHHPTKEQLREFSTSQLGPAL